MAGTQKHVLIVEDERPLAHALELKLQGSGFTVSVAQDGQEALDLLKETKIDLILLDLVMPKMDGFSFLEAMKEAGNATPVIVTSNLNQAEDEERAASLGAKGFFVKSNMSIKDIVQEVQHFLV